MNKIELTYSPYSIKLSKPFETSKGKISERNGFIITLKSESGKTGTGDAAPFPEFGSESHEEAEDALNHFELKINIDLNDIRKSLKYTFRKFESFPALRHGLEQALLNLICSEAKTSVSELLNLQLRKNINVNAAIGFLSPADAAKTAKEFISSGFNTIKIKAGRKNFVEDLETVNNVRDIVGGEVKIRIDVNGKWNLDTAANNLKQLEKLDIEYAEQPVNSLEEFIELKKESTVPLAADESIRNLVAARTFIINRAVDIIVLKPMMIGGLISTLEIINLAEQNKVIPVVTSSFETAIGRTNAVIAAASIQSDIAHGLGISQYYEDDIAEDKFQIISGKISI